MPAEIDLTDGRHLTLLVIDGQRGGPSGETGESTERGGIGHRDPSVRSGPREFGQPCQFLLRGPGADRHPNETVSGDAADNETLVGEAGDLGLGVVDRP